MTILGTGIDIVETKRIGESLERFGERFLHRVFLEGEVAYSQSMKFPHLHLAARFAAKEAVSKAFGTGIGKEIGWRDMEIVREPGGQPHVVLRKKLLENGLTSLWIPRVAHVVPAVPILASGKLDMRECLRLAREAAAPAESSVAS